MTNFVFFSLQLLCSMLGALFVYGLTSILKISFNPAELNMVESPVSPTVVIFVVGFFFASVRALLLEHFYSRI